MDKNITHKNEPDLKSRQCNGLHIVRVDGQNWTEAVKLHIELYTFSMEYILFPYPF